MATSQLADNQARNDLCVLGSSEGRVYPDTGGFVSMHYEALLQRLSLRQRGNGRFPAEKRTRWGHLYDAS
jgi:hypothetical protein